MWMIFFTRLNELNNDSLCFLQFSDKKKKHFHWRANPSKNLRINSPSHLIMTYISKTTPIMNFADVTIMNVICAATSQRVIGCDWVITLHPSQLFISVSLYMKSISTLLIWQIFMANRLTFFQLISTLNQKYLIHEY